jgi:hypothetical protein
MSYLYCQECGNYLGSLGGDTCHCGWVNQDFPDFSPPAAQRQWVGLTDIEWMNIVNKDQAWFGQRPDEVAHEVAKLVEAKLKEKNA